MAGVFDWDGLINLTLEPPWKPKLSSADDDGYFESEGKMECLEMQKSEGAKPPDPEADEEYRAVWEAFADADDSDSSPSQQPAPPRAAS